MKIGMNCNESLIILFPFDSSRFSGQTSRICMGIPKKDISMFHVKKDISRLLAIGSFLEVFVSFHIAEGLMSCGQMGFQTMIERRVIIDVNRS
jgi:hypothetical protein